MTNYRRIAPLLGCAIAAGAFAQAPGAAVRLDLYPTLVSGRGEDNAIRYFDVLGHYSTVGLRFNFEEGFDAFASERLQVVRNSADDEQLDQYYIEDPGIWRLGKQYLPFGHQAILREAARAAEIQSRLLLRGLPLEVAACDNGARKAQGVVGRIGGPYGVSFAIGHDFGAESTDFDVIRHPEDAPGDGHGYRTILGADFGRHSGMYRFEVEVALLRAGETALDKDNEISDAAMTITPNFYRSITVGWSRDWEGGHNFFRAQGRFLVSKHLWLEPTVRFRDQSFFDLGITLHLRI